jgi:hypothetical protein
MRRRIGERVHDRGKIRIAGIAARRRYTRHLAFLIRFSPFALAGNSVLKLYLVWPGERTS